MSCKPLYCKTMFSFECLGLFIRLLTGHISHTSIISCMILRSSDSHVHCKYTCTYLVKSSRRSSVQPAAGFIFGSTKCSEKGSISFHSFCDLPGFFPTSKTSLVCTKSMHDQKQKKSNSNFNKRSHTINSHTTCGF